MLSSLPLYELEDVVKQKVCLDAVLRRKDRRLPFGVRTFCFLADCVTTSILITDNNVDFCRSQSRKFETPHIFFMRLSNSAGSDQSVRSIDYIDDSAIHTFGTNSCMINTVSIVLRADQDNRLGRLACVLCDSLRSQIVWTTVDSLFRKRR